MKFQDWQNKQEMNKKKKQTNQELLEVLSEINNKEEIDYSETLQEIKKIVDEKSIDLSEVISTIKGIKIEQKEIDLSSVVKAIENIPKPEKVVIPEQKEDKKTHSLLEKISKFKLPKSFWLNGEQFKALINKLTDITDAVEKVKTSVSVSGGSGGGSFDKTGLSTEDKQDDIITAINNSGGGTSFHTNEIYENGTDTYFCKEASDGEWYVMKIDTNSVFTHATVTNNPAVTSYADARTNVTTLTYETYNQAF